MVLNTPLSFVFPWVRRGSFPEKRTPPLSLSLSPTSVCPPTPERRTHPQKKHRPIKRTRSLDFSCQHGHIPRRQRQQFLVPSVQPIESSTTRDLREPDHEQKRHQRQPILEWAGRHQGCRDTREGKARHLSHETDYLANSSDWSLTREHQDRVREFNQVMGECLSCFRSSSMYVPGRSHRRRGKEKSASLVQQQTTSHIHSTRAHNTQNRAHCCHF